MALKTIELDNEICHGQALQVRVVEGKEPIHFMSIFEGRIIIYKVSLFEIKFFFNNKTHKNYRKEKLLGQKIVKLLKKMKK